MGWTMRLAMPEDAPRLAVAASAFFRDTFGDANTADDMEAYLAGAFAEPRQRAELSEPEGRVWLAIDDGGEIAGYVHVRQNAPQADVTFDISQCPVEIVRLYADRSWHGRGLGAALMEQAVATARAWGADVLWLGVWEKNPRAIAFYEKQGFETVGNQEFLLGNDRQRDLVMARRLTTWGA
jgi:diamine N-acetyltransferase